jgi:hypothetical protein
MFTAKSRDTDALATIPVPSRKAGQRLKWFDYYESGGMTKERPKTICSAVMLPQV